MRRFEVRWSKDVERDFIDLWADGSTETRRKLSDAANLVDDALSQSPDRKGEAVPSEPDLRVWRLSDPLRQIAVTYEVKRTERVVRVIRLSVGL